MCGKVADGACARAYEMLFYSYTVSISWRQLEDVLQLMQRAADINMRTEETAAGVCRTYPLVCVTQKGSTR